MTARLLDPEATKRPELSFHDAMNDAVQAGQVEMIQCLHARSQQHPDVVQGTPDANVLMEICKLNRLNVAQLLLDLHVDDIDAKFVHVLADTLQESRDRDETRVSRKRPTRGQPEDIVSLFPLLIQRRPKPHPAVLQTVAGAGCMEAVNYMLDSRSGVDTKTMALLPAIVATARARHRKVMDFLLSCKRDDDVIDVATSVGSGNKCVGSTVKRKTKRGRR